MIFSENSTESELAELQRIFVIILRKFFKVHDRDFYDAAGSDIDRLNVIFGGLGHPKTTSRSNPERTLIEIYKTLKAIGIAGDKFANFSTGRDILSDLGSWQYDVFRAMADLFRKRLAGYVISVNLNGSFGSQDFIESWSDADVVVFLKDKVFDTEQDLRYVKKELAKLALFLYKIDPLMHHEFIFVTEFDLGYYPPSFFPPNIFVKGVRLFGDDTINICFRDDSKSRFIDLYKVVKHFRRIVSQEKTSADKFLWKNDLATMFIWPSRMLQAMGIYVYKKESFKEVQSLFPLLDFSPLTRATEIMERWRSLNLLRFYPNVFLKFGSYRLNRLIFDSYKFFAKKMPTEQNYKEKERLSKDFLALAESGLEALKKDDEK